jgi:ribonuclease T2
VRQVLVALALLAPVPAVAQAYSCAVPQALPELRPDLPSAEQPRRLLPTGGYTLAISWSPEFCRSRGDQPSSAFQCGSDNRFGFVLHGLWPDGVGKDWPQYCRATGLLPDAVVRGALCATPSAQLLQHEWAKHGTCMPGLTPADYFRRSNALFAKLRYPAMDALSRRPLTAGGLAVAIARANRGLTARGMRITTRPGGWLDEVWICLDRRFRYRTCPAHQGGVAPSTRVKIWRGVR